QEIKTKITQLSVDGLPSLPFKYFHTAERSGYSGTAIFSKVPYRILDEKYFQSDINPITQSAKFPDDLIEPQEGRVQVVDGCSTISNASTVNEFFLVNVYTPNAGAELKRLKFRHELWDPKFCEFLEALNRRKPLIVCGDFNVAHREIDLAHPNQNHHNPGFTHEEREGFSRYLAHGFVDVFRQFHPHQLNCYTWWSYRTAARQRNVGWRIDYFLASQAIASKIKNIQIYTHIMGSDHAPLGIEL
ncbi:MAG: exodeoxyribonuclease III, partial [Puniceicoccales bacterium]|nr:exodeoxyribonuclease III [Puniceicoccales bacterium]